MAEQLSSPLDPVRLRNGTNEARAVVQSTMLAIQAVGWMAQFEAIEIARDPSHEPWGDTREELEAAGLLRGGRMHDSVRNILISAALGDGAGLVLRSPTPSPDEAVQS